MNTLAKPSRTARKIAKLKDKKALEKHEREQKAEARNRDGGRCRFPLCGCRRLGLQPRVEVSHDRHKGMGGNPAGDRSDAAGLITLCEHRHQHGVFSRHAGTLRARYLTDEGNNGRVAWDLDLDTLQRFGFYGLVIPLRAAVVIDDGWIEVAREVHVQQLAPLSVWQHALLMMLARMEQ